MLRKGAKRPPEVEVVPAPSTPDDATLDAVAAILRALARHLATSGGSASRLEDWARHILLLVPPPSQPEALQPAERDWDGLRRFVVRHIRDEGTSSARAIGDLHDALWAVVAGLSEALHADASDDDRAGGCLARLRQAAHGSTEELKRVAVETAAELRAMIESRNERHRELARGLGQRVDVLRDELAEARCAASVDRLTQLANRALLEPELQRAIHMHRLTTQPYALLLVDVDGFKGVNDTFGHVVGDDALRAIADALAVSFPRRSDLVCRFGGDEFAVILHEASLEDAERLARRFVDLVRSREITAGEGEIRITVSVGVAPVEPADGVHSWLARADRALYAAKADGRDRVAAAVGDESEPAAA